MTTLAEEISARRARVNALRDELHTEEIKLAALEEFAAKQFRPETEQFVASRPMRRRAPLAPPIRQPERINREVDGRRRARPRDRINEPIEKVPLKVLIVKALIESFPDGTSSNNLQHWIESNFNRKTSQNAFNATLALLKQMGEVVIENRLWRATEKGKEDEVTQK